MDETVRKYIDRALEVSQASRDNLTDADLAEIARDVGLSSQDLARVNVAVSDGLQRGQSFLQQQAWDLAIQELDHIAPLAPNDVAVQVALGTGYAERYLAQHDETDATTALERLNHVMTLAPGNRQAASLIARVTQTSNVRPRTSPSPLAATMIMLGVLVAIGMVLYWVTRVDAPSVAFEETSAQPLTKTLISPPAETPPATFDTSFSAVDGLKFNLRHSEHKRYTEKSFVTVWADFEVTGAMEVEAVDGQLELLDDAGEVVHKKVVRLWQSHDATLRKGDRGVFDILTEGVPAATGANIKVTQVKSTPSLGGYAASKPIELRWLNEPPAHTSVTVHERSTARPTPTLAYFKGTWEFTNSGTTPIRKLAYHIHQLDSSGNILTSNKQYVTIASKPPVLAGETRVMHMTVKAAPESFAGYALEVIEFE